MYDLQLHDQPAAIYLRISDDREGKRLGVKRQEKDNRSLAECLGVKVKKIYSDNDISAGPASKKPRKDYDAMLSAAREGGITVIIAYSTSRLTRRTREHEDLIDLAVTYGIRFYFVASPTYDLNTADGREAARNAAARDTGEVERLQERIVRKKQEDALDGKYPGGQRTYGIGGLIGIDPRTKKEVYDWTLANDAEVKVIREIADRLLEGESQFAIVRDLNERGITTAKGFDWQVGKIKRLLLKECYVIFDSDDEEKRGTRVHHGNKYRAVWPGIFTHTEHDLLARLFDNNPFCWQQGKVISRRYLLTGYIFCGNCGGVMTGQGKTENGKYIRRYHCKKYNTRGEQVGCCKVFRIADPVEQLVSEAVLYRFDSPEVAAALAPHEDKVRVRELTQQVVQLQKRRQDLAAEHAITPYEDYGIMLGAIKDKMDTAQTELMRLRSEKVKKAMIPADGNLRAAWEGASLEWKASVIKLLVKKVVIHPGRTGGKKYAGWRFDPDLVEIVWSD
jgi:DNA invertase Pin-like site-specific DNA recombinase